MGGDFFFPSQQMMLYLPVAPPRSGEPCSGSYWFRGHVAYMFGLTLWINAKRILELGTGWTPEQSEAMAAFLPALSITGGHLTTIDIKDCTQAKSKVAALGMDDYVTFIQGDDRTVEVEGPFDLVFLDSSKEAGHAKDELARFGPMLRPGGYFVCHDTQDPQYIGYRDAVLHWAESNDWPWEEYTHGCGLFVMRRPP